jgi:hypothetical protein
MKLISILALVLFTEIAIACSCSTSLIDLPIEEMGWTQNETPGISSISNIIFTGVLLDYKKVEEISQDALFNEYKSTKYELIFKLIKSYKGDKNDTMKIRTNFGTDACGFYAPKNTECLIFGVAGRFGYYYTYRSDCCKSISKAADERRYHKYITFLESLTKMIDGEYIFYQSKRYWRAGYPDNVDTLEAIRYNIKNGKLEGTWQIKDLKGRVLEKGEYKNGQKIGTWELTSFKDSDLAYFGEQLSVERISYHNGKPRKSVTHIIDRAFVGEKPIHAQTIRKQIVHRRYKHFTPKSKRNPS